MHRLLFSALYILRMLWNKCMSFVLGSLISDFLCVLSVCQVCADWVDDIQQFFLYLIEFIIYQIRGLMIDVVNITGFQAFGNVSVNPTELIIKELKKNPHIKLRRIQGLNVTVKAVDSYVNYLSYSCNAKQGRTLNLHMGVGPNKVYYLEQCGYNNKDFRIPDNDGYICKNEKIQGNYNLDHPINTKINLQWLSGELKKQGHKVDISNDPGRYLCNYIYFNSLNKVCGDHCTSLFVHFPDLDVTTHEQNVKFITDLINILTTKN